PAHHEEQVPEVSEANGGEEGHLCAHRDAPRVRWEAGEGFAARTARAQVRSSGYAARSCSYSAPASRGVRRESRSATSRLLSRPTHASTRASCSGICRRWCSPVSSPAAAVITATTPHVQRQAGGPSPTSGPAAAVIPASSVAAVLSTR